ncbi:hypothetical protein GCM10009865_43320 [Aeromicrobium ponti]
MGTKWPFTTYVLKVKAKTTGNPVVFAYQCVEFRGHLQQRKELRFQFIEDHHSEFRLEKMYGVLEVSRSGYYKWHKEKENENRPELPTGFAVTDFSALS